MTNRSTDIGASGGASIASEGRYKPYPAYKDSGVEWLREIPTHWEMKRVNQISEILRGKFAHRPRNDPSLYDGPYPFVQTGDVTRARKEITSYRQTLNERGLGVSKMFPSGTLVMTIAANIGDVAVLDFEACFPDSVVGFIPRCGIERDFLFYVFLAMKPELLREAPVNTQGNLNIERIGSIGSPIPMPGKSEQRAIAAFLDRETANIDALVAKKERLIELLQEKRTSLISHAVTKGLDPDVPLKDSGVEWLGEIPAHWIGLPLKRWVAVKITDGPHETPQFVPDGVDFISAEAVSNRKINFDKRRGFISPELHAYYSRKCKPIRDDILICKSGATTGKLARVDTDHEFGIWSPLAIVRSNRSRIIPRFLEIALEAEYVQNQIKRTWSAGTQPNISMGDLERLHVVAPDIEEQRKILAYVDSKTDGFNPIIAKVQEAIDHLKELRTALISAAVTGKVDVREAAA